MTSTVTYLRVSTTKQGQSGLGLEAQRSAVASYKPVREFVEVESGKNNDRTQLAAAMRYCRVHKATLVIAKLDRLSRNAAFLLTLMESAGFEIIAADMPTANRMTLSIMAVVAQAEAEMISKRTSAALQAKKAQGAVLGGYRGGEGYKAAAKAASAARTVSADLRATDICPMIKELQEQGIVSLRGLARALTERGVPKARGGLSWSPTDVGNVMARCA